MMITKKANKPHRSYLILLLLSAFLLSGCNNEDNECDAVVETAGEPDLTGAPAFVDPTVMPGGTVDVNVPVDGETLAGTVFLLANDSQDVATQVASTVFAAPQTVAETVTVTLTVDGAAAVGTYYPVVVLCGIADAAACDPGAGYVQDISGLLADAGNYVRGTTNAGDVDLSSLTDSCIAINRITVN